MLRNLWDGLKHLKEDGMKKVAHWRAAAPVELQSIKPEYVLTLQIWQSREYSSVGETNWTRLLRFHSNSGVLIGDVFKRRRD